jgi:hypothetical protein
MRFDFGDDRVDRLTISVGYRPALDIWSAPHEWAVSPSGGRWWPVGPPDPPFIERALDHSHYRVVWPDTGEITTAPHLDAAVKAVEDFLEGET